MTSNGFNVSLVFNVVVTFEFSSIIFIHEELRGYLGIVPIRFDNKTQNKLLKEKEPHKTKIWLMMSNFVFFTTTKRI